MAVCEQNNWGERVSARIAFAVALAFALALLLACLVPSRAFAADERYLLLADTHLGLPNGTAYGDTEKALSWAAGIDNLAAVCVAGDLTDRGAAASYSDWEYLCDTIVPDAVRIQALGDHDTGKGGIYLEDDPKLTTLNGLRHFLRINDGKLMSFHEFDNANIVTIGGVRDAGWAVVTDGMISTLNSCLKKTARQGKMAIVVCHYPHSSSVLDQRVKLMGGLRSYPNVIYVSGHRHRYSFVRQCDLIAPVATTTPFVRAGFDRNKRYSIYTIGVNACSSSRSNDYVYADLLQTTDAGAVTLGKWNVSLNKLDCAWSFHQAKSSVIVKCAALGAARSRDISFTYKVTFSDGGTYGGVKSGSTFKLALGAKKSFGSIPAGVLVNIKPVGSQTGWSRPSAKSIEVGIAPQVVRMVTKPADKRVATEASKLRAAAL